MNLKQACVDLVGLIGVGLVSYGSWLVYQPAAFIVSGVLLTAWAIAASGKGEG